MALLSSLTSARELLLPSSLSFLFVRKVCVCGGGMVTLNIHTHTLTHLFLPMSREACEVSCTHAFSLSGSQQKEVSGIVRHTCTHSLTDSWQPVLFCPCSCPLQAPSSLSLAAFLLADTHTRSGDNRSEAHSCTHTKTQHTVESGNLLRAPL